MGRGEGGAGVGVNLAEERWLLFAGHTKNEAAGAARAFLAELLRRFKPGQLRVVAARDKGWPQFDGAPHLACPPIRDPRALFAALDWAKAELQRPEGPDLLLALEELDHIVEFGVPAEACDDDWFMNPDKEDELRRKIQDLRRADRKDRLRVVVTSEAACHTMAGDIVKVFDTRFVFNVCDSVYSRDYLQKAGAERLLGKGDALRKCATGGIDRFQARQLDRPDFSAALKSLPRTDAAFDGRLMAAIEAACPKREGGEWTEAGE